MDRQKSKRHVPFQLLESPRTPSYTTVIYAGDLPPTHAGAMIVPSVLVRSSEPRLLDDMGHVLVVFLGL